MPADRYTFTVELTTYKAFIMLKFQNLEELVCAVLILIVKRNMHISMKKLHVW